MTELSPGTVVGLRYRLDRVLGEGGMGKVWAATHTVTHKPVALKFLKPKDDDGQLRRRFLREARAACKVSHPNIVAVHDVVELEDGTPLMVMDLLEGESLGDYLDQHPRLSLRETATLLAPVISAAGAAHAMGIVHRDLKPDNVFLSPRADGSTDVKVLDFGIAKLTALDAEGTETGGLTSTGSMLGTPYYMSPEQAFAERDVDHRADIWSLGIILYECLAGVRPTQADSVGQILRIVMKAGIRPLFELRPDLPEDVTSLVTRMLSRERDDRPADLREVLHVINAYAVGSVPGFDAPARSQSSSGETPAPAPRPRRAPTPTPFAHTRPSSPDAETLLDPSLARNLDRGARTAGALSTSVLTPRTSRRSTWIVIAISAGVAAGLAAFWAVTSSKVPEPVATPPVTLPKEIAQPASTPAAAPSTAPATPTVSAEVSARPPVRAVAPKPKPKTTASATPAPPTTVTAAPGGVVDRPPF